MNEIEKFVSFVLIFATFCQLLLAYKVKNVSISPLSINNKFWLYFCIQTVELALWPTIIRGMSNFFELSLPIFCSFFLMVILIKQIR